MRFEYPLRKTDDTPYTAKELLSLLTQEPSGHYLLGNHNIWHGGVHFTACDENSPLWHCTNSNSIRAIADGRIVAYRIDPTHHMSFFTQFKAEEKANRPPMQVQQPKQIGNVARYSTSFCLIEHEYKSGTGSIPTQPEPTQPVRAPQDWVNRYIEFERNVIVRNPNATADGTGKNACAFKGLLEATSKARVIARNGDYLEIQILYFGGQRKDLKDLGRGKRLQTKETSLKDVRPGKTGSIKLGDRVYLRAFRNGQIVGPGRDIFKEYIPHNWDATTEIEVKGNSYKGASIAPSTGNVDLDLSITSGTILSAVNTMPRMLIDGSYYKCVTASINLPSTRTEQVMDTNGKTITRPVVISAGTQFWIPITDVHGNTVTYRTGSGDNAADIPAVKDKTPAKTNQLKFYSLYMHLLPYQEHQAIIREKHKNLVITIEEIHDAFLNYDKDFETNKISLPNNTVVEIVEQRDNWIRCYPTDRNGKRAQNAQELQFSIRSFLPGKNYRVKHFVHTPAQATAGMIPSHWYDQAHVKSEVFKVVEALRFNSQNNQYTTHVELLPGTTFEYSMLTDVQRNVVINLNGANVQVDLLTCKLVEGVFLSSANKLAAGDQFYLILNEKLRASTFDTVTPLPTNMVRVVTCDIPVSAGDPIGLMGRYDSLRIDSEKQVVNGLNEKHQLHFEIFTNANPVDLELFLNNTANVKDGRKFLITKRRTPVYYANSATDVQNSRQPDLNLARNRVFPLSDIVIAKDNQDKTWFQVPALDRTTQPGDAENLVTQAWIKEEQGQVEVVSQHDWKKLGFTVIREMNPAGFGFAPRELPTSPMALTWVDVQENDYGALTNFYNDLFSHIESKTDTDNVVSSKEMQAALGNEQIHEILRKVIAYHPTEWRDTIDSDKWKVIEASVATPEELAVLAHEKQRIATLHFWSFIAPIIPEPSIHHFHPIEFIYTMGVSVKAPIKIAIDAGHGGTEMTTGKWTPPVPNLDNGNPWNFTQTNLGDVKDQRVYEWDFNDAVAKFVAEELEQYQNVITKRTDDATGKVIDEGRSARGTSAKNWKAPHLLCIHHNAGGSGSAWGNFNFGVHVYIHRNDIPNQSLSRRIAQTSVDGMYSGMGINPKESGGVMQAHDWGVVTTFVGNNNNYQSLIYTEFGFFDSAKNIQKLLYPNHKLHIENLRAEAKAIVLAYERHLHLIKK